MKADITTPEFQPIELIITLEYEAELIDLYNATESYSSIGILREELRKEVKK